MATRKDPINPDMFRWPPSPGRELRNEIDRYLVDREPLSLDGSQGIRGALESRLKTFFGRRHALLFNSGTAALQASYFALNLPRGARVACPVYTYPATVMPMLSLGLRPLFCDADPRTANVTIESVKHAILSGAEAIVVTHMWGLPCDVAEIRHLAEARGLKIIEDASHAPGAEINGVKAGALGDLAALSFQAFKLIWAGEGGVLLTDDDELYSRAVVFGHNQRRIVELGADNPYASYAPLGYGLKLRIHPLGAVIASHALQQLPEVIERQRSSAPVLDAALRDSPLAEPPATTPSTRRVYYTYKPLLKDPETAEQTREKIVSFLQGRGIPARIPDSGPLSDHPIFRDGKGQLFGLDLKPEREGFPGAHRFFRSAITIPFPNTGAEEEIQQVADAMRSAFGGAHPKEC